MNVSGCVIDVNFICLMGSLQDSGLQCAFVNVYAPCNREGKQQLWSRLVELKLNSGIDFWCLLGDFNAVRAAEERRGLGVESQTQRMETQEFNAFIENMELLDLPLVGRKFTWIRPNGQQMSRLDRVLISADWVISQSSYVQEVLERNISDHYPLLLRRQLINWGPKPFRVLDCWFTDSRFKRVVHDIWNDFQVDGGVPTY